MNDGQIIIEYFWLNLDNGLIKALFLYINKLSGNLHIDL